MAEPKRRKWASILWKSALGLVAVVAVSLLLFQLSTSHELDEQIAAARAEGLPTTAADMVRMPPVPASENAAPYYREAINAYRTPTVHFETDVPIDDASRAGIKAAWTTNQPALNLFFRGAALPHCDFADNWREHKETRVLELVGPIKLIDLQADVLCKHGQAIDALKLLQRIIRMPQHMRESPRFISFLVSLVVEATIDERISAILDEAGDQPGVANLAKSVLEFEGPDPDLAPPLAAYNYEEIARVTASSLNTAVQEDEVALTAMPASKSRDRFASMIAPYQKLAGAAHWPGVVNAWQIAAWKKDRAEIAAARKPGETYLDLAAACEKAETAEKSGVISGMYSCQRASPVPRFTDAAQMLLRHRLLVEGSAIFIAWNETGKLPLTLPIQGSVSLNPITGKPLAYAITANGFKIWGSDRKGVDHGGTDADRAFQFPAAPKSASTR